MITHAQRDKIAELATAAAPLYEHLDWQWIRTADTDCHELTPVTGGRLALAIADHVQRVLAGESRSYASGGLHVELAEDGDEVTVTFVHEVGAIKLTDRQRADLAGQDTIADVAALDGGDQ